MSDAQTLREPPLWGVLALLWLAGIYLRLPILVIPPLTPALTQDLPLSQTLMGSLTTLPVLMLSFGALLAALAISRLGARNTLVLALGLVLLTSAARALSNTPSSLLVWSALMGLGIALMQPALPALLPGWLNPKRLALGTAVYMNGMLLGEFLGAGLTLPLLMPLTGEDWRLTLVLWSLPGLLLLPFFFLPKLKAEPPSASPVHWFPDLTNPLVWQLGLLLAASASLFFGTNAYLASLLESRGEAHLLQAGYFWFNLAQVASSLLMLLMARRWVGQRGPLWLSTIGCLIGMAGLLLTQGWLSLVFAFSLSFWAGVLLILVVALPPQLLPGKEAGRLAAGAFMLAYSLSFLLPLLGGLVADWSGQPQWALITLLILATPALWICRQFKSV